MLNIDMNSTDKQKIASFLDTTKDFLFSGYKGEPREYNFDDTVTPAPPSCTLTGNADSLEQIAQEIRACQNCPLGNTRKNAVPGEGVNQPLVMVIGEGPGADEDSQGRPFVGKAGQLLDKMLFSINLSRNDNCFIANVVKCRPPQNRDPYPEETAACAHFLQRQISILKPKFILLVGNVASQTVLKATERVGKLRGKFTEYKTEEQTIPLLVTYHPSALLHNEDYKRPAWEDLKLLRSEIDKATTVYVKEN
jgi:DNA polymerase